MIKITKSYSKHFIALFRKLSFGALDRAIEIPNAFTNLRVFKIEYTGEFPNIRLMGFDMEMKDHVFEYTGEFPNIRLMGFDMEMKDHVFDFYLDFKEGHACVDCLNDKINKNLVCHPHLFVNSKYRGLGIITQLLNYYRSRGITFIFNCVTKEGLEFIKKWHKKNNIKYVFLDKCGKPRRQSNQHAFMLTERF